MAVIDEQDDDADDPMVARTEWMYHIQKATKLKHKLIGGPLIRKVHKPKLFEKHMAGLVSMAKHMKTVLKDIPYIADAPTLEARKFRIKEIEAAIAWIEKYKLLRESDGRTDYTYYSNKEATERQG